jgi:hypothetical protein
MALTLGNFIGFETGGIEEASGTVGTPSVTTSYTPPTGTYCLNIGGTSGHTYKINAFELNSDAGDDQIFGFRFKMTNEPAVSSGWTCVSARENGDHILGVRIYNDAGNVKLRLEDDSANTATGTTTISLNTWYVIEVKWDHVASGGTATLYLDGSSEITLSSADLSAGGTFDEYWIVSSNGQQTIYDDFYCYSGATSVTEFLGEPEVYAHVVTNETTATPDYVGVATADTPSAATTGTWDNTDDYSTSTTLVYGDGAGGGADGIAMNASITEDPVAIKGLWHMKRTAGDTAVTHYGVIGNSGDGVVNTADFNPSTAYNTYFYGSESTTVKPLASEEIRLGVEVVE